MSRSILITASLIVLSLIYITGERTIQPPTQVSFDQGTINLEKWNTINQPVFALNGQWKFFPNKLLQPSELSINAPYAHLINVPGSWHNAIDSHSYLSKSYGVGTYWLSLKGKQTPSSINISLEQSCSTAIVFFFPDSKPNLSPIAQLGHTASTKQDSLAYAGSTQFNLAFTGSTPHHLLIQVSNFDSHTGGLCANIHLGTVEGLTQYKSNIAIRHSVLITIITMAAFYPLALYLRHRQEPAPLWLSFTCLSAATFFLVIGGFLEQAISVKHWWVFELRTKLAYITIGWAATALLMFYHSNFSNIVSHKRLLTNLKITGFSTLLIVLLPAKTLSILLLVFIAYWVIQFLISLRILIQAIVEKRPYTKPMLIAFIPLFATLPFEVISGLNLNSISMTGIYCLIFFIIVENQIIAQKFADAFKLAARLSQNLTEEVSLQTAALNKKNQQLEDAQSKLRSSNQSLKKLSITDGLTQLYNRSYFDQELANEWRRATRQRTHLSILMIDIDFFKHLNDSAGHLAGDQALKLLSAQLKQHFKRAGELVARYGGEEFAVILPNTNQPMALFVAESLRQVIEKLSFSYNNKRYRVTVSIGICSTIPSASYAEDDLLRGADSALYDAKNKGRNLVSMMPLFPSQTQNRQQH